MTWIKNIVTRSRRLRGDLPACSQVKAGYPLVAAAELQKCADCHIIDLRYITDLNQIQSGSQATKGGGVIQGNSKLVWIMACSLAANIIILLLVVLAFTNMKLITWPVNAPPQNPTVNPDTSSGMAGTQPTGTASTPPSTPPTTPSPASTTPPAATPAPSSAPPQQQTPVQPPGTPASTPSQVINAFDPTVVITRQASQMILTPADMGSGWMVSNALPPSKSQVYSSSLVQYTQGGAFSQKVNNMVMVCRSITAAQNTFDMEKPDNVSLKNPNIGNESYLNDSVAINKELVFRKNNVVVWVWVLNDRVGDPEQYARIVLEKIYP
jgi:hypothetical protein